jgi:hypothetical protein
MVPLETDMQTLFNVAVRKLSAQGGPSRNESGCVYLSEDGRNCGVGAMLPREIIDLLKSYRRNGTAINRLLVDGGIGAPVREALQPWIEMPGTFHVFLSHMQNAHDSALVEHVSDDEKWGDPWSFGIAIKLQVVGEKFGLNTSVVKECWPR